MVNSRRGPHFFTRARSTGCCQFSAEFEDDVVLQQTMFEGRGHHSPVFLEKLPGCSISLRQPGDHTIIRPSAPGSPGPPGSPMILKSRAPLSANPTAQAVLAMRRQERGMCGSSRHSDASVWCPSMTRSPTATIFALTGSTSKAAKMLRRPSANSTCHPRHRQSPVMATPVPTMVKAPQTHRRPISVSHHLTHG